VTLGHKGRNGHQFGFDGPDSGHHFGLRGRGRGNGHGNGHGQFCIGGRQSPSMGIIRSVHLVRELMPPLSQHRKPARPALQHGRRPRPIGWCDPPIGVAELHDVSPASPVNSWVPAARRADRDGDRLIVAGPGEEHLDHDGGRLDCQSESAWGIKPRNSEDTPSREWGDSNIPIRAAAWMSRRI